MEKTEICTKTMRAQKGQINVEREIHKKTKPDTIASAVMGDMFYPQVNQGKAHIRYVSTDLLKHPTFKSDLVVGLVRFDYCVLFTFPRRQAVDCYSRLFQSFCIRGWLAKELTSVHMDNYFEFVDDLRFVSLDEMHIGPKIGDMVIFLSSSPELSKRECTSYVFKLSCLCLANVVTELPKMSLVSFD